MVAFCAIIQPYLAKIGIFNASADFVKAESRFWLFGLENDRVAERIEL